MSAIELVPEREEEAKAVALAAPAQSFRSQLAVWSKSQSAALEKLAEGAREITVAGHVDGPEAGREAADSKRKTLKAVRCDITNEAKRVGAELRSLATETTDTGARLVAIIAPEEDRLSAEIEQQDNRRLEGRLREADESGVRDRIDLKIAKDAADITWRKHIADRIEAKRVADEEAQRIEARDALRSARLGQARALGATLDDIGDLDALPGIPDDVWETTVHLWEQRKADADAQAEKDAAERTRLEEVERQRIADQQRLESELAERRRAAARMNERMLDKTWAGWRGVVCDPDTLGTATEADMENYLAVAESHAEKERLEDVRQVRLERLEEVFPGWYEGRGRGPETPVEDLSVVSDEAFLGYLSAAKEDKRIADRTRFERERELNGIWPNWDADLSTISDSEYAEILQSCKDARKCADEAAAKAEAERPARLRAAEWLDAVAAFVRNQPVPEGLPEHIAAQLIRAREDILHIASTAAAEIKEEA